VVQFDVRNKRDTGNAPRESKALPSRTSIAGTKKARSLRALNKDRAKA